MNTLKNISLGNDIIDLFDPDTTNLSNNVRFVNRVFTPEEIKYSLNQSDSNLNFWILWAAKEASYKAIRRLKPETVFSPKKFKMSDKIGNDSLIMTFNEFKLDISLDYNNEYILALAKYNMNNIQCKYSVESYKDIEIQIKKNKISQITSYSQESSFCRSWAQYKIRKESDSDDGEIVYSDKIPVFKFKNKSYLVSLSHHGRFCSVFWTYP